MIAVFCRNQRDLEDLKVTPPELFKRIRNNRDIIGRRFDGIIRIHDWYKDADMLDAYHFLELRQPELFDKTLKKDSSTNDKPFNEDNVNNPFLKTFE